jgi:hypothetical protein
VVEEAEQHDQQDQDERTVEDDAPEDSARPEEQSSTTCRTRPCGLRLRCLPAAEEAKDINDGIPGRFTQRLPIANEIDGLLGSLDRADLSKSLSGRIEQPGMVAKHRGGVELPAPGEHAKLAGAPDPIVHAMVGVAPLHGITLPANS